MVCEEPVQPTWLCRQCLCMMQWSGEQHKICREGVDCKTGKALEISSCTLFKVSAGLGRSIKCCAEELCQHMELVGAEKVGDSGMVMNPFTGQWSFSGDKAVNYIMSFRRATKQQHSAQYVPQSRQ